MRARCARPPALPQENSWEMARFPYGGTFEAATAAAAARTRPSVGNVISPQLLRSLSGTFGQR
eukprot:10829359-Alexandrium_andersonii.AAC.1